VTIFPNDQVTEEKLREYENALFGLCMVWLVGWLVCWLVGWLVGWFVAFFWSGVQGY